MKWITNAKQVLIVNSTRNCLNEHEQEKKKKKKGLSIQCYMQQVLNY